MIDQYIAYILLQENAEKQAELDRAIREKRAVEQELETVKFVML